MTATTSPVHGTWKPAPARLCRASAPPAGETVMDVGRRLACRDTARTRRRFTRHSPERTQ